MSSYGSKIAGGDRYVTAPPDIYGKGDGFGYDSAKPQTLAPPQPPPLPPPSPPSYYFPAPLPSSQGMYPQAWQEPSVGPASGLPPPPLPPPPSPYSSSQPEYPPSPMVSKYSQSSPSGAPIRIMETDGSGSQFKYGKKYKWMKLRRFVVRRRLALGTGDYMLKKVNVALVPLYCVVTKVEVKMADYGGRQLADYKVADVQDAEKFGSYQLVDASAPDILQKKIAF
ncbi:unnamed protein product [Angiostrongylus costaricensis]|uniref:Uncharacterized protein n=1 Tax=Angiostrongylus costaricensis TaxID=334426 RepID=A0A158PJK5_ANGCS|nr:unnamed protein product [Angiostrongylus costaricensis]